MDALMGLAVAKKASKTPKEPNPIIFAMRGSADYKGWLAESADQLGLSVTDFVANAIRLYAKSEGIKKLPPRR